MEIKDNLNILSNKKITSMIPSSEQLLWSGCLSKINMKGKRQIRDFIITSEKVYNLGNQNSFIEKIFCRTLRRQFKVEDITGVTYSLISNNFIFHITSEYDYYLSTPDKDFILLYILNIQKQKNIEPLKFYFIDDIELEKFTKYSGQKVEKLPSVQPISFEPESF